MPGALLSVDEIGVSFGGVAALDGASLHVSPGEVCGLIGPNGAGKSTLLNCVSGFVAPARGRIAVAGRDTAALRPHAIARLGVARTFQHLGLLERCSVRDNVRLGCLRRRPPRSRRSRDGHGAAARAASARVADELVERLGLAAVADAHPGSLDHGLLRRVEIARALAGEPLLVLLDEPLSGVGAPEAAELIALLAELRAEAGLALLVIEHNVGLLRSVADRLVVLDCGRTLAEGDPDAVLADPAVVTAYLGAAR